MLASRAVVLGRAVATGMKAKLATGHSKQIVRNSSHAWFYRTGGSTDHSKKTIYGAQAVSGLMWWWVLWHLWHEPGHIFGEFDYPDVSKWTDAELGIPPDNYEE